LELGISLVLGAWNLELLKSLREKFHKLFLRTARTIAKTRSLFCGEVNGF
jgi:hypothetical protein